MNENPLSEYAKFSIQLTGFNVYLNDVRINRWELFHSGYTDAESILNGTTKFKARAK